MFQQLAIFDYMQIDNRTKSSEPAYFKGIPFDFGVTCRIKKINRRKNNASNDQAIEKQDEDQKKFIVQV
jgi:hypothetical protein